MLVEALRRAREIRSGAGTLMARFRFVFPHVCGPSSRPAFLPASQRAQLPAATPELLVPVVLETPRSAIAPPTAATLLTEGSRTTTDIASLHVTRRASTVSVVEAAVKAADRCGMQVSTLPPPADAASAITMSRRVWARGWRARAGDARGEQTKYTCVNQSLGRSRCRPGGNRRASPKRCVHPHGSPLRGPRPGVPPGRPSRRRALRARPAAPGPLRPPPLLQRETGRRRPAPAPGVWKGSAAQ